MIAFAETQSIPLRKGWNAVCIQVEPANVAPGAVFANTPVDKAATYFPSRSSVEFIQDPASEPWKQKGWRAWFAPQLPESAVNDLFAVNAWQCYLVHTTAATTLTVNGSLAARRTKWRADSFNFVGFSIDPDFPPTFQSWFAGSSAHQSSSKPAIYTLDSSEVWKPVDHPETTPIQPGVAYWVFCNGSSDYQGPLDLSFPTAGQNQGDFGGLTESVSIKLANNLPSPLAVKVELSPEGALPISYQKSLLNLGEKVSIPLAGSTSLGPIEPGAFINFKMTLDRAAMTKPSGAAVLTVRDDVGTMIRIPVTGSLP